MKLSEAEGKTLHKPGLHSGGDALHLFIIKSGDRRWVHRISFGGRRRNIGLGGCPAVKLWTLWPPPEF